MQLIHTVNEFAIILNNGGKVDALFLDFSKAFDKVPMQDLFKNLNTTKYVHNLFTR